MTGGLLAEFTSRVEQYYINLYGHDSIKGEGRNDSHQ